MRVADRGRDSVSVAFVGTYPPTRCGIATFMAALREAMGLPRTGVVASVELPGGDFGPEVVAELMRGSRASLAMAASVLERYDVAIVQHEFGIYGGEDGREVVDLVAALETPTIAVFHTVLRSPSLNQRSIVEELAEKAKSVVVQSLPARARLLAGYDVDPSKVQVVPHGARLNLAGRTTMDPGRRPTVLTWGLIGPGKGIEFGITAIAALVDLDPPPRYLVQGGTHPRVLEHEGEAYRNSLVARAQELGVTELVEFEDRYVDTDTVLASIREADVVLLPYSSRDQVVSGVLVEALASAKPVVATRFPHAEELLAAGSGILVPHDDAGAIARALRRLLTDRDLRADMARIAEKQAHSLDWSSVGRTYRQLANAAALRPTRTVG
jgi:glycosyltransferase involved in cell wall biosynthesis